MGAAIDLTKHKGDRGHGDLIFKATFVGDTMVGKSFAIAQRCQEFLPENSILNTSHIFKHLPENILNGLNPDLEMDFGLLISSGYSYRASALRRCYTTRVQTAGLDLFLQLQDTSGE